MRHHAKALSLLALANLLHGQQLPYNPTQLSLLANYSTVYMFRPATDSPSQAELLKLDLTGTISASSLPWSTVTDSLPFVQDGDARSYSPAVQSDGSITVVAGNCSAGADGIEIWRYLPEWAKGSGADTWSASVITDIKIQDATGTGPAYLSSSIAFSEHVGGSADNTKIYTFGGMCPTPDSTTANWQAAAEYSNSMLIVSPSGEAEDVESYGLKTLDNRGPPIPQAGVTITPLLPTYSLGSSGQPQTQQQNFVLLGGHTQTAFINTSQVAVFSLPQQSWSFMPARQPVNAKSDLARRQATEVTPRSGHTAVLSEDGSSVIVYGGWVGDINTPATPQLAVLKLGDGYGGSGEWAWNVPPQSGAAPSGSLGIYGHGAAMLPGGVMMIAGGYEIASGGAKRMKRNTQSANTRTLFYNVTDHTWLDSYSVPSDYVNQVLGSPGPLSSTGQKVGLGTGLGLGAAILVSVVALYFWYSKRVKRASEDRERNLLVHSSDGSSVGPMEQPFLENGGIDGRGGDEFALGRFWPAQAQSNNGYPRPPPMQHTTGTFVNIPSPTRGLRRGGGGKNFQYQPAPRYDDNRMSRASNNIHPIAEQENEDEVVSIKSDREQLDDAEAKLKEIERVLNSEDPFTDPVPNPLGSHPVSPAAGSTMRRVPTGASAISMPARKPVPQSQPVPNWIAEPGADESEGRTSPSRSDDRTSSTLSERSQRSDASSNSITRTMSTRTGAILAAAMAAQRRPNGQETSPTRERTQTMSSDVSYIQTRARSSTNGSITPGGLNAGNRDSFISAGTGFEYLQNEGQALLGGRSEVDPDDPYQRAMAAQNPTRSNTVAPSYSKGPPPMASRRGQGLLGSLRRALNVVALGDRSFSLTSSAERYRDDPQSAASSPTKERSDRIGGTPRRAVSDGGALLRQKRGQQDWDEKDFAPYKDDPEDWGEPKPPIYREQLEAEWDVEDAANRRDFQVMFTVPKSRLRVVNDDMDRASLRSASDSIVSRNGSVKELTREESIKALKARMESDMNRLPSTEEEVDEAEKEKTA
jgi:hypothetical protein